MADATRAEVMTGELIDGVLRSNPEATDLVLQRRRLFAPKQEPVKVHEGTLMVGDQEYSAYLLNSLAGVEFSEVADTIASLSREGNMNSIKIYERQIGQSGIRVKKYPKTVIIFGEPEAHEHTDLDPKGFVQRLVNVGAKLRCRYLDGVEIRSAEVFAMIDDGKENGYFYVLEEMLYDGKDLDDVVRDEDKARYAKQIELAERVKRQLGLDPNEMNFTVVGDGRLILNAREDFSIK